MSFKAFLMIYTTYLYRFAIFLCTNLENTLKIKIVEKISMTQK